MPSRYAVPLAELERSAHVPVKEQVSEQGEPPPPPPLPQGEFERVRLLSVSGPVWPLRADDGRAARR